MTDRIAHELRYLVGYLCLGVLAELGAFAWWLTRTLPTAEGDISPLSAFAATGQPRLVYFSILFVAFGLTRLAYIAWTESRTGKTR
jgi:hypothetical protein